MYLSTVLIDVDKCEDPLVSDTCQPFMHKITISNMCDPLRSKSPYLAHFFLKVKPPPGCPLNTGVTYVFNDIPVNSPILEYAILYLW